MAHSQYGNGQGTNGNSSYGQSTNTGGQYTNAQYPQSQYGYGQYANPYQGSTQYNYPPGYTNPYPQPQPAQSTVPYIQNPFAPPPPARSAYAGQNAAFDPEQEAKMAQWQSAYAPQEQSDGGKKGIKTEKGENPNLIQVGPRGPGATKGVSQGGDAKVKVDEEDTKTTVIRKGGGQTWEDPSLKEWDPTQFRIIVGNLAGEVTDDSLAKAFAQYGVSKTRVVRDKRTTKSKGYGFVSFLDGEQGFKAAREMSGKYIGSHPVTIQRSKTDIKPVVKKDKKSKNNHNKDKDKAVKQDDGLRAHTGAHVEKKKPTKNSAGMRIIG